MDLGLLVVLLETSSDWRLNGLMVVLYLASLVVNLSVLE